MSLQRPSLFVLAPALQVAATRGHSPHALEQIQGISDEPVRPCAQHIMRGLGIDLMDDEFWMLASRTTPWASFA